MSAAPAVDDLRAATCSNGAPSARNLLVTVFGDALLPYGPGTTASVRSLVGLLSSFGVNDRLVRTSLSRLVSDDLLATLNEGRRSFYRVAPEALSLFAQADERIYHHSEAEWDGAWTLVVIDGNESTPSQRSRLRQELAWVGFGTVAPNVMASPIADPAAAESAVAHVGAVSGVLVTRSLVSDGDASISPTELARRCAPLDELGSRYHEFADRFGGFTVGAAESMEPQLAFKLRTLLIASFRRIALSDPQLPASLLPADWAGDRARVCASSLYETVFESSEAFLRDHVELDDRPAGAPGRFAVGL